MIGVLEPLACMYSQEGLLVTETLWEDLRPSLILYLHANLSTNHINSLWREGKNFCNTTISYSQLIERSKSLLFFPEEARIFAQEFCREFLLAVRPKLAIISVAASNSYGHPSPDVLRRLEAIGAKVRMTSEEGSIVISRFGVG